MNIDFGMSLSPSLPPSTGSQRSVNIARMENQYNSIASSISDLVSNQTVRRPHQISDNLIATIENKLMLQNNNGDQMLIDAVTQKISGLKRELKYAQQWEEKMCSEFNERVSDAGSIPSLFTSENEDSSRSDTLPDQRPAVRQRRSAD